MSPKTTVIVPLLVFVSVMCVTQAFKWHAFCGAPPMDMKTRFPLYRMEVNTKIAGIPWAYRQNNTIEVSIKALYQQYKIKRLFMSVPSMTKGTPERPARKIYLGQWKWQMKGGVIPLDCNNKHGGFRRRKHRGNAVRDLWWYPDGFYNVTAEWDPLNTIYNAYRIDMVEFEVFVSPDPEPPQRPPQGGPPPPNRWVKLTSDKYVNLDYIDLQRYLQLNPQFMFMMNGMMT